MLTDTSREAVGLQGQHKPPCTPKPVLEPHLWFPAWLCRAGSKVLTNISAKCMSVAQTPILCLSK